MIALPLTFIEIEDSNIEIYYPFAFNSPCTKHILLVDITNMVIFIDYILKANSF